MSTLYIHIGIPKTGSTAIQQTLFENPEPLLSEGFVYYPNELGVDTHNPLARSWFENSADSTFEKWRYLKRYCDNSKNHVIISSEMFPKTFHNKPESIDDIATALFGVNVYFVIYLRRQDSHIQSMYNQRVKKFKNPGTIPEFIESFHQEFPCDYYAFVSSIAARFGNEKLIIRPFEKEQLIGKDVRTDFLSALGVSNPEQFAFKSGNPNPRLKADTFAVFQEIGRMDIPWSRKLAAGNFFRTSLETGSRTESFQDHSTFPPPTRLEIFTRHAHSNAKVAREFLGREDGNLFYAPPPNPDTHWEPYPGLQPETAICMITQLFLEVEKLQNLNNSSGKDSFQKA
ncbi:hypothetical protein [Desulfovibrio oxyclinae]|uniref:hypothetical protein n=1 Tax=Desulfovibrio oxyclinae TaxID=63560 RepID=UPI00036AEC2D|nr:hypothetical protein [Desulfovibrio oxyclinae]